MRFAGAALVLALLLTACSDDGSTPGADSDAAATTDMGDQQPCPEQTGLTLVNADDRTGFSGAPIDLASGPMQVETSFADGTGGNADLVFTDYPFEEDPQFGLSAPVGDPDAPGGGLIFSVSITTGGEGDIAVGEYRALEPGEGAVSSPGDLTDPDASIPDIPPSVNFEYLYLGAERVLIGRHAVTLTEVTDTRLCGEITGDTRTSDLQADGFPVVTGRFVVDRV